MPSKLQYAFIALIAAYGALTNAAAGPYTMLGAAFGAGLVAFVIVSWYNGRGEEPDIKPLQDDEPTS